jgi:hypothetical protein
MSDGVYSHTYYGHYNWFTPWPFTTQMVKDIRTMVKEPKFQGMYSETHLHWGTQGLTFWLHPRLMWNPDLDVDAAIADYCRAAYGPAGAQMEHYYATLQKQMDSLSYICGYAVEIPQLLNESVIEKCDRHIDAAERYLDQMDEGMRWRTNLAIQSWRNSAKFAQACNLYVNSSNPHDRERIVTLVDEVDEFAQSQLGRWAFEYRIVKPQLDTISQNLRVNLHNLPAGTHVFNDSFNMGGAIKFFAAMKGWQMGMWGYSLPVNGTGEIELPLQAEARHRITSARVRWQIANPERVSGTLSVVSDDGNERILMKDVQQMTQGVDVPAEALGGLIRLRLRLLSQYHDPSIVLTGCNIEVQVE